MALRRSRRGVRGATIGREIVGGDLRALPPERREVHRLAGPLQAQQRALLLRQRFQQPAREHRRGGAQRKGGVGRGVGLVAPGWREDHPELAAVGEAEPGVAVGVQRQPGARGPEREQQLLHPTRRHLPRRRELPALSQRVGDVPRRAVECEGRGAAVAGRAGVHRALHPVGEGRGEGLAAALLRPELRHVGGLRVGHLQPAVPLEQPLPAPQLAPSPAFCQAREHDGALPQVALLERLRRELGAVRALEIAAPGGAGQPQLLRHRLQLLVDPRPAPRTGSGLPRRALAAAAAPLPALAHLAPREGRGRQQEPQQAAGRPAHPRCARPRHSPEAPPCCCDVGRFIFPRGECIR